MSKGTVYETPFGNPDTASVNYNHINGAFPNDSGIRIAANATAAQFGGDFMIMQTVDSQRYYTDANGRSFHMPNVGFGMDLDINDLPIGWVLWNDTTQVEAGDPNKPNEFLYSWHLNPGATDVEYSIEDKISIPTPISSRALSAGDFSNVQTPNLEQFNTYLMYKPVSGVWTALSMVHWEWGIRGTNNNGWQFDNAMNPSNVSTPLPSVTSPWPSWTGLTADILSNGWVPM